MTDRKITTEDRVVLGVGDRAYNYYDMQPGHIERISDRPQPDTMKGQTTNTPIEEWDNYWFTFRHDDGSSCSLDGSRICSEATARRKGWLK